MRRLTIITGIILLFTVSMTAQNRNNFDSNWEKVKQLEEQDLPQSIISEIDVILKKAISENNTQQVIKALLVKNKYKIPINKEEDTAIFGELNKLISTTNKEEEKALLHSLLAELYNNYYNADKWKFNNRTAIMSTLDDMKEWSWNNFSDKVLYHLQYSIKDESILKTHTTKEYSDIIELGKDSQQYYPTLFDFLIKRAIEQAENIATGEYTSTIDRTGFTSKELAVPADKFIQLNIGEKPETLTLYYYKKYLKDLLDRKMTSTIILTELTKANYIARLSWDFRQNNLSDFYKELIEKYKKNEAVVSIIREMADNLLKSSDSKENLSQAYEWASKGAKLYPNYPLTDNLKEVLNSLESPQLDINVKNISHPKKDIKIEILHKNLHSLGKSISIKLYRINGEDSLFIKQYPINYVSKTNYLTERDTLNIGKLNIGKYYFEIPELNKNVTKVGFTVSQLAAFSRNNEKNSYQVYVVDRITGKPVENATVSIYKNQAKTLDINKDKPIASGKTNKSGLATLNNIKAINGKDYFNGSYIIQYGDDIYPAKPVNLNYRFYHDYYVSNEPDEMDHLISIFTDRDIYRPGQTVYFKGIVMNELQKTVTNEKVTVELLDNNNNTIQTKELNTNDFGSVAGEFILPSNGLLGYYSIKMDTEEGDNEYGIRVEEYKRPTFEVTFDKVEKTYTFGEEITVKGYAKNFSGINLQDATVEYTVQGRKYSFWWFDGTSTFAENGKVRTNSDGSFEIKFVPKASENKSGFWHSNDIQQYTIDAKVTDLNNETQTGSFSLLVGNVSMAINIKIPDMIEKSDTNKVSIEARNLNGTIIDTSGEYIIYSLDSNDSVKVEAGRGSFLTGEQAALRTQLNKLVSGKYRINLSAKDSNGKDVETKKDFLIFSYKDKQPPIKTNDWLVEKNTAFSPTKPAEVLLGVSDKDVYILYQLYNDEKIFENKLITLSQSNKMFTIPYKEEYGKQIYLSLTYVKDEQYYNKNILLKKEEKDSDRNLNVRMEVFRDRLRPGDKETWTISVKDPEGNPVLSELLASMYDSSLDKLTGNYTRSWGITYPYKGSQYIQPYYYSQAIDNYWTTYNSRSYSWYYQIEYGDFQFDKLNLFGLQFGNRPNIMIRGSAKFEASLEDQLMGKVAGVVTSVADEAQAVLAENSVVSAAGREPDSSMEDSGMEIEVRKNFNETAFFYPQLRTNEYGETLISFTAPESNTKWRFRAIAYDKDLRSGSIEKYIVTRKELMVTPNIPRFTRQGDRTSISTKISNLSDKAISGEVYIEFFDPLTEKAIDIEVNNKKQQFTLEKESSSSASWIFDIPQDIELLGCRIIAKNETFSDGEQHVLPVLSNRMMIIESMPFDISEAGQKMFVYDKMKNNQSKTLSNYRLTLEYTSNPAWYAVMALPTLSNPESDNAVSWFASYYVNSLGASIMQQYPQVSNMIQAWKKQGGDKETLLSNLQKDEELKGVLLSETPWILEARNESEQMQRLSLLFDLNDNKQKTDAATRKLIDLQDNMGGWSWYKGFYPSRDITQYILIGYAHLQTLGMMQYSSEIKGMQIMALNFLDKEIASDFEQLKKNKDWEKTKRITTNQLEYLYARSYYRDIPITQEARKAERFYTSVASKNWKELDLYARSILIPVLIKNGDKVLAQQISRSVRERAITDKNGMYWPNNTNSQFATGLAIVNHTFCMAALQETGASEKEMDMMKLWLIKQKQTQAWQTTHGTINAISALLGTGSNWFTAKEKTPFIKVGNETVNTKNAELGTGYMKTSWNKTEITPDMATVTIDKEDNQPAYGALYWQYYEDIDKVAKNKTGLHIEKQLLKEQNNSLVTIEKNHPLQVGDKVVVRLTVRTDKDIDFVRLKDMRAPCFEPIETLSQTKWKDGTIYYQETRDASTNFYFDRLKKGTYVLEYNVYVNRRGSYSNGISTIESMYAPEFKSHTEGITVIVE